MSGAGGSLWLDGSAPLARPAAAGEIRADVAVVGAGITGVTAALLLAQAGKRVVVCEAGTVAGGTSGHNTAKVTALQATVYSRIARRHGAEAAASYATASAAAVERVAELADGIDCGLQRRPAATFALEPGEVAAVRGEARAAAAAGLPVKEVGSLDLPCPVHAAVRLEDQLLLHPVAYVRGLARRAEDAGAVFYEGSRVVRLEAGDPHRLHVEGGVLTAHHVVVATHYPVFDRGLWFARLAPSRSYCVAARVAGEPPADLAISAGSNARSFASYGETAILGGESHPVGDRKASPERFARLESDARRWFDVAAVTHRWSAQDPTTYDDLPVIGPYGPLADRLFVASGYMKWGLSTGTLAGMLLADAILGRDNPWAATFHPQRLTRSALPRLAKMNGKVAVDLVGDRLRAGEVGSASEVPAGEARVLLRGTRRTGVYRDPAGGVHAVSLRCTHLGCLLRFNGAETSWDCPCHGSRFDVDGNVLEGPAGRPLERHQVD